VLKICTLAEHWCGARGSVVVKPEVHGFETRLNCLIAPAALGHGVCSAFNRSEYQTQKNVSGE
jgi:hypothetical protein